LTPTDLKELEGLLVEAGASAGDLERAQAEAAGLAVFVRSLVGLDRVAAKALFNEFLAGGRPSANQIEFLDLLIDHLTEQGVMDESRLYESPFIDVSPAGPESLFGTAQADRLVAVLRGLRLRAA
jgi:type I restriction enzyme R subunit